MGVAQFRHVNAIESLEEERLNELGYYTGFACPHGHLIRDSSEHWCYECAKKILSNVCGFDVNYLQSDYRIKYAKVWSQVTSPSPMSAGRSTDPLAPHQSVCVFRLIAPSTASRSPKTSISIRRSTSAPGAMWDPFLSHVCVGTNGAATHCTWFQALIETSRLRQLPLASRNLKPRS